MAIQKIIPIPDIHGRTTWKDVIEKENPDKIVFVGDYFDSFDISGINQIQNFKDIIEFKKSSNKEVILLIGNHDLHYFSSIGNTGTSGFQPTMFQSINKVIEENKHYLQMCHIHDNFLFSHAGISQRWLDDLGYNGEPLEEFVNEMWKYKPITFVFNGLNPYGDDIQQTPVWIRPKSLMKINKLSELKKKYIQIVGHTQQNEIDIKGKTTGKKYYFIDTFGHSKAQEYLVIEDGKIKLEKL
jgi:UDP-2,3-diacylglucosamine pyrophosphatase LpxH